MQQPPYQSDPNRPQYPPQGQQQPYYPPQQYQQPPMQQGPGAPLQAPKKPRRWPWIVACFVCLMLGYAAGNSASHDTPATTDTTTQSAAPTALVTHTTPVVAKPTATSKPLVWTVTQTLNGNGTKKTDTFTVGNVWKLQWSCDPTQNAIGQYNVIVDVDASDGTPVDPGAINTICKPGNTSGETIERQSGSVFLNVTSEDAWSVKVLEMK